MVLVADPAFSVFQVLINALSWCNTGGALNTGAANTPKT
jgi:hypothetical protein